MAKHINILGSLFLILNILMIMLGFVTNYILGTMPGLGKISHESIAMRITSIIGENWGLFSFILSLPGLICGYGLLIKKSWSRTFGIVLSCLYILFFPVGTAIGIYGLWILFKKETIDLLSSQQSIT